MGAPAKRRNIYTGLIEKIKKEKVYWARRTLKKPEFKPVIEAFGQEGTLYVSAYAGPRTTLRFVRDVGKEKAKDLFKRIGPVRVAKLFRAFRFSLIRTFAEKTSPFSALILIETFPLRQASELIDKFPADKLAKFVEVGPARAEALFNTYGDMAVDFVNTVGLKKAVGVADLLILNYWNPSRLLEKAGYDIKKLKKRAAPEGTLFTPSVWPEIPYGIRKAFSEAEIATILKALTPDKLSWLVRNAGPKTTLKLLAEVDPEIISERWDYVIRALRRRGGRGRSIDDIIRYLKSK